MRIYEKKDFKDLPDFFWVLWLDRVKQEIIDTSYPLFMVRVGICDNTPEEENKLYQNMWDIKETEKDATFLHYFIADNKYIALHVNTIYDYIDLQIDEI
mgnify:CR=1 FL=1